MVTGRLLNQAQQSPNNKEKPGDYLQRLLSVLNPFVYHKPMENDDASMALNALHKAMQGCSLCLQHGYPIEPRAIFSGPHSASIMVIGQAPGQKEVETGLPFSGPAGKRLFSWLEKAGFEEKSLRKEQYFTAITKCYPGKGGSRGDRVPTAAERSMCLPFLAREIQLVQPRILIPVGAVAINHFLGKVKLNDCIGKAFRLDGRLVIPLPHPSGANLWLNLASSQSLLNKALACLERVSATLSLGE